MSGSLEVFGISERAAGGTGKLENHARTREHRRCSYTGDEERYVEGMRLQSLLHDCNV